MVVYIENCSIWCRCGCAQLAARCSNLDLGVVAGPQTPRGEIYRHFKNYEARSYRFLKLHFLNFRSPHLIIFEKEQ